RTARARARAGLDDVTDARGRAADGRAGDESVGGTRRARSVAAFDHVAHARRAPADEARRPARVGRTRGRRAGAALGDVAGAGRRTTDGGRLEAAHGGAARAGRTVRAAQVARFLRLDDRVATDRQRRDRPAGRHAIVVEDLRVHVD